MSSIYRIHGARFLRKYTAAERTSAYAYMSDVRKIADTLCKVPWTRVGGDVQATMTLHTEEGLDWNEPERDRFDAAEWCADHSDGMHRAFAQAACYVFELPTSAIGTAIEKIGVTVTSDPYNPYGARISALTSDTLTIPMDCATVRTGDMYRAPDENGMGAAPRLYVTNSDGSQTWYANTEAVELEPAATLLAKKYLFVFVCLENYNRGRDGWIEGSSYIENDVSLTLADACADLALDELNDLSFAPVLNFPVLCGGIFPYVPAGAAVGERRVVVRADANLVTEADGHQTASREAPGEDAAAALSRLYAEFYAGGGDTPSADGSVCSQGASFNVTRQTEDIPSAESDRPVPTDVLHIDASVLLVPFVWPSDATPTALALAFDEPSLSDGARFNVFLADGYLTALTEEQLKNPGLYDGRNPPFRLLGSIDSGTEATFKLSPTTARTGTIVISAWFPPERYSLTDGGRQGTGANGLVPTITLV